MRVGRAGIEARELATKPDHVLHAREGLGHGDDVGEGHARVDELGHTAGSGLGVELGDGIVTLLLRERFVPVAKVIEHDR